MFGRKAAAKYLLLAEESAKYIGDNQGMLNLKVMQQLHHVVAYNLAILRAARDGSNKLMRTNFRPRHSRKMASY